MPAIYNAPAMQFPAQTVFGTPMLKYNLTPLKAGLEGASNPQPISVADLVAETTDLVKVR